MNSRNWTIRSKIIALVAVPIAALLVLWIFATTLTIEPAFRLLDAQSLLNNMGRPGTAVVTELQQERRLSMRYLAAGGDLTALGEQRARTDQAVAEMRRLTYGSGLLDSSGELRSRVDQLFTAMDALPAGRGFIDRRDMDRSGAFGLYSGAISSSYPVFETMAARSYDGLNLQALNLIALGHAGEVLEQVDAVLAGAFAAGRFEDGDYVQLVQAIGTQQFLHEEAVGDLPEADRAGYQRMIGGDDFIRVRAMLADLVAKGRTGAAPPVNAEAWQSSYDSIRQQLRGFELDVADALTERSTPIAIRILVQLGLAGLLGLAAVVLSLFIAIRIGRSLVGRLTGLRTAALELAGQRLPEVVGRLRRGEEVDVSREVPDLEYGRDEIGQVGHAFSEVQRTAIRSAVDEATLRRGLSDVFLNIARRSQTLLHRQLAVLDRMERRVTEPEELEDLFRIDHMATRMRRHAEDLVILAGAAPGRGWRHPVSMIDVMRGAISEVEDYARVDVEAVHPAATVGPAVGDVIHLLAELIENATAFSPPHTRVRVTGQVVPNGYAIEVEDRGLGMNLEAIEAANRRLADPPEFDPVHSARLGLFVVAQLASRHGVKVQLRPSPYGGVTAVALVPSELVVPGSGMLALPGRPAGPTAQNPPTRPGSALEGETLSARTLTRLTAVPSLRESRSPGRAPGPALVPVPFSAPTEDGPPAADSADGLPRRIRQTSLAPQLREPVADPAGGPTVRDRERVEQPEPTNRSPEEVRVLMSALQAGTARGRRDAGTPPGSASPQATALASPLASAPDSSADAPVTDPGSTDSGRDA
jgi:hypothetical protein